MGIVSNITSLFSKKDKFQNYVSTQKSGIQGINDRIQNGEIQYSLNDFKHDIQKEEMLPNLEQYQIREVINRCEEFKDAKIQEGIDASVEGLMKITGKIQEQEAIYQKEQTGKTTQMQLEKERAGSSSTTSTTSTTSNVSSSAGNQVTVKPQNTTELEQKQVPNDQVLEEKTEIEEMQEDKERDDDGEER